MAVRIDQVDTFTAEPFAGNPAAVVVLDEGASEAWMQAVAAEMNLSETAFTWPEGDAWRLRWFTPVDEVALCGHATLATAFILWQRGLIDAGSPAQFETLSGRLTARRDGDWIAIDLPAAPVEPRAPPAGLWDSLGAQGEYLGRNTIGDDLVLLAAEESVRDLRPEPRDVAALGGRGLIVTAAGTRRDYVCRCFAPALGIDEDPVTGSAQCALAPYWAERTGRAEFRAQQVSPRGGELRVRLEGDRVVVAGQAVTVMNGTIVGPGGAPRPGAVGLAPA